MEENRLKLKISGIFRSSLSSCHSKNLSDVMEKPFFFTQNPHHHHQLIELFSPKPPPLFPSICRPKSSQKQQKENTRSCPRTKVTDRTPLPSFPAHKNIDNQENIERKKRKSRRPRRRKPNSKSKEKFDELFSSVAGNYSGWYSSSEDENEDKCDDGTTLFSSKSISSDSSESFLGNRTNKMQGKVERKEIEKDLNQLLKGKVKDSFAVVKRSSDPYNDFRTSMVEMIVERQIFGSKELENLLQCFLSLNSVCHHRVIVEVFAEIWETLFCNWG